MGAPTSFLCKRHLSYVKKKELQRNWNFYV